MVAAKQPPKNVKVLAILRLRYYDGYVHHINKLAEENGMSMKVVGTVLRETDLGVDQEFDLPDPQIFHSKMYKPLKIMLHCRIEF